MEKRFLYILIAVVVALSLGNRLSVARETEAKDAAAQRVRVEVGSKASMADARNEQRLRKVTFRRLEIPGGQAPVGGAIEKRKDGAGSPEVVKEKEGLKGNKAKGVCIAYPSGERVEIKTRTKPKKMKRVRILGFKKRGKSGPREMGSALNHTDSPKLRDLKTKREARKARFKRRLKDRPARQAFRNRRKARGIREEVEGVEHEAAWKGPSKAESETVGLAREKRSGAKKSRRFEDYFPKRDKGADSGPGGIRVEKRSSTTR